MENWFWLCVLKIWRWIIAQLKVEWCISLNQYLDMFRRGRGTRNKRVAHIAFEWLYKNLKFLNSQVFTNFLWILKLILEFWQQLRLSSRIPAHHLQPANVLTWNDWKRWVESYRFRAINCSDEGSCVIRPIPNELWCCEMRTQLWKMDVT